MEKKGVLLESERPCFIPWNSYPCAKMKEICRVLVWENSETTHFQN